MQHTYQLIAGLLLPFAGTALGCTVSDLLGETPGALPAVPEGPTEQFLKLFSILDDKAQNEIVAEMLKRKK